MRHSRGLTFDEFEVGAKYVSQARTVTEADAVTFAGISGDFNLLHTDAEFSKNTPFGGRIAPSGVNTQMTATIPEKVMAGILQQIPYRRMAEPEEIAAVHAFLASDQASYITGQLLFVDGGMSIGV